MRSIRFSPAADQDLVDIYRYTIRQWGAEQAAYYKQRLDDAFAKLVESPSLLGRSRDGLPAGYFLYHAEHHLIIFQFCDRFLDIARVLHERMDVTLRRF